jgi:hypothetical protein
METIKIEVVGYWIGEPEKTFFKTCVIGEWDGNENDDHIFFYFDNEKSIVGDHGDFVVIDYAICS